MRKEKKYIIENGVAWTETPPVNVAELGQWLKWSKGSDLFTAYKTPSVEKREIWNEWKVYFARLATQRNTETGGIVHHVVPQMYVMSRNAFQFTIGCRIGNTFYYVTKTRRERTLITDLL